ncbi:hypothetical protein EVAR_70564_1 [Eumeta japonica]|uniref:Uncharacterized protein n=1 Tax=Eumeta variegata TaxID=151549 RepID=A0A4C1SY05_EUMVA|nr:hypothetical protein EVAR_70564_1 [Eumeta japonica]
MSLHVLHGKPLLSIPISFTFFNPVIGTVLDFGSGHALDFDSDSILGFDPGPVFKVPNMGLISAIVVGAVGGLSLATGIGPAVVAPLLGFSPTGIVSGTMAASAQSYYGSVSAGSVISALTSIAMTPTP